MPEGRPWPRTPALCTQRGPAPLTVLLEVHAGCWTNGATSEVGLGRPCACAGGLAGVGSRKTAALWPGPPQRLLDTGLHQRPCGLRVWKLGRREHTDVAAVLRGSPCRRDASSSSRFNQSSRFHGAWGPTVSSPWGRPGCGNTSQLLRCQRALTCWAHQGVRVAPGTALPARDPGDVPEVSAESRRRRPAQTCRPRNLGPRPRPGLTCSSGTPAAHPFRGSGPLRIFQVRSSGPGCNRRKPCSGCYPLPAPMEPSRAGASVHTTSPCPRRPPSVRVPVMLSPPQPCPPLRNHRFP